MWSCAVTVCASVLFVCVWVGADSNSRVLYDGAQLLRVTAASPEHKERLKEIQDKQDVELLRLGPGDDDLLVRQERLAAVKKSLSAARLQYKVIIDDVQRAIDAENPPPPTTAVRGVGHKGHNMTWDRYHRLSDITGYLHYLAKAYPKRVTLQTVGRSVEGRPLIVLKVSSGQPHAKAIWIDGGTHAREWISHAAVTYLAGELAVHADRHAALTKGVDYYIMPVLNPDGYEYSHSQDRLWRKNRANHGKCQGTDLNRNWGHTWGGTGGSSEAPCSQTYRGPRAFSEPETASVSRYIRENKADIKGFLTFHSFGQLILHPWGYTAERPADHDDLVRVGRRMAEALGKEGGRRYTVGTALGLLYPASGSANDWAKLEGIKYSYTIELPGTSFCPPPDQIEPASRDVLTAVRVLAETVRTTP